MSAVRHRGIFWIGSDSLLSLINTKIRFLIQGVYVGGWIGGIGPSPYLEIEPQTDDGVPAQKVSKVNGLVPGVSTVANPSGLARKPKPAHVRDLHYPWVLGPGNTDDGAFEIGPDVTAMHFPPSQVTKEKVIGVGAVGVGIVNSYDLVPG
jgi:hypothetical protein